MFPIETLAADLAAMPIAILALKAGVEVGQHVGGVHRRHR